MKLGNIATIKKGKHIYKQGEPVGVRVATAIIKDSIAPDPDKLTKEERQFISKGRKKRRGKK